MQPQDKEDSEGEEEESKEPRIPIQSPQDDPATTIDTRDEESKIAAAADGDSEERKDDEIDEILEESKSYTKAVSDR